MTAKNIFLYTCLLLLSACSVTKFVPEGEYLYKGATIDYQVLDSAQIPTPLKESMTEALFPTPSSKLWMWWYYKGEQYKQRKKNPFIMGYLTRKFGEKPVYYNSSLTKTVSKNLSDMLFNNGFFLAHAYGDTVHHEKGKGISVVYHAKVQGPAYKVDSLVYMSDSSTLWKTIEEVGVQQAIQHKPYNLDRLVNQRNRIDSYLKNRGYFAFSAADLDYQADTSLAGRHMALGLRIKPETSYRATEVFQMDSITVRPDFDIDGMSVSRNHETLRLPMFTYIGNPKNLRPKVLEQVILLRPGELYSKSKHEMTLRRLSALGIFKYINMTFAQGPMLDNGRRALNANLIMSQMTQKSLSLELGAATFSTGFTGPEVGFTWRHRNLFGGAENLTIKAETGLQLQFGGNSTRGVDYIIWSQLEAQLNVPRIISPIPFRLNYNEYVPHTNIGLEYDRYDFHPLLRLNYVKGFYGYDWKTNSALSYVLNPINISYQQSGDQTGTLDTLTQQVPGLLSTFRNQFIVGSNVSVTYNKLNKVKETGTGHYFYIGLDAAGNLLSAIQSLAKAKKDDNGSYTLFGRPYSQYVRFTPEVKLYQRITKRSMLASRLLVGVGIPLKNSEALPFVEQYVIGGPNSIRAFRFRTIGPGSYYPDSTQQFNFAEHGGDLKFEANLELRFDLNEYVKPAIFLDAGNVWLYKHNPDRPGTTFEARNFAKQMAIGTGFGLRFDFTFFVLRFDFGVPLHVPYTEDENGPLASQWVIKDFSWRWLRKNTVFNLAIGYPF